MNGEMLQSMVQVRVQVRVHAQARAVLGILSMALLAACGGQEPAPAAPRAAATPADPALRALTKSECGSLAQWIVDACRDRATLRSAQVDGWCGDVEHRTTGDDSSWFAECVMHVKYIDYTCFRSTTSVRSLMDCDSTVSR